MKNPTNKLYYNDLYLSACQTKIVEIGSDYIETESTIAYPEGGGQESDIGTITANEDVTVRFTSVHKLYGIPVRDCNTGLFVDTGGVIRHYITSEDIDLLNSFQIGMEVTVSIDITRRALLSLSHSASHLLYIAVGSVRPDILKNTIGCHIKIDGARFDFFTDNRFTPEELRLVCEIANNMVDHNSGINLYAYDSLPDYRFWECDGHTIPCGGTHVARTGIIGQMSVKRRGVGKNKERISCVFSDFHPEINKYHD